MHSLSLSYLSKQTITLSLAQSMRHIGEFKGQHDLYVQQRPEVLENLKQSAVIDGADFYGNGHPHTIVRSFAINERTLVPVSTFCQNINNLRETDEGKWLFRSFDSDRLLWAVQSNADNDIRDDECCT